MNPQEKLSPGQSEEVSRIYKQYPELNDDEFVSKHLQEWLMPLT